MPSNKIKSLALICLAGTSLSLGAQQRSEQTNEVASLAKRISALEQKAKNNEGLKISGYVQMYYQTGEQDAKLSVGAKQEDSNQSYSRIGIRRGRAKISYSKGIATGVLQLDMTERGVGVKDVYLKVALPFLGQSSLQAGIFDRPFGHEISYSSSRRESPERSLITPSLFPNERDLGVMLSLSGKKGSPWQAIRLDAGLFAGQGIKTDVDSRLDFIGRLSGKHKFSSSVEAGLGTSLYYGSVYQTTSQLYRMQDSRFVLEDKPEHIGAYARRSYLGIDAQITWRNPLGRTEFRGEFITGEQPSSATSNKSPNGSLQTTAMYLRPISGGYALLTQGIGRTPLTLFTRYDWYDPNTKVSGNEVGTAGTTEADLSYRTLGLGAMYQFSDALRLTLYGEQVWNEKTSQLAKFAGDRKDNRLTLALLYKF